MEHSFDIELAKKYGIKEAIIYKHFLFWIIKNKANKKNFKDGRYWTYGSLKAFHEIFPYMSERELQLSLQRLVDNGVLMVGCFNKTPYDRTKWYAFTEEPEELKRINASDKKSIPFNKMLNGTNEMCEPIPDIITDNNKDNNIYNNINNTAQTKNKGIQADKPLVLSKSQDLPEKKKPLKPKLQLHQQLWEYFAQKYHRHTKMPYLAKKEEFVLLARLVKDFGAAVVKQKMDWLETGCLHPGVFWFAEDMNSFTIKTLFSHWNSILPKLTEEQKKQQEEEKMLKEIEADLEAQGFDISGTKKLKGQEKVGY